MYNGGDIHDLSAKVCHRIRRTLCSGGLRYHVKCRGVHVNTISRKTRRNPCANGAAQLSILSASRSALSMAELQVSPSNRMRTCCPVYALPTVISQFCSCPMHAFFSLVHYNIRSRLHVSIRA